MKHGEGDCREGAVTYQSAPWEMVSVQAAPRAAKSAERIEGAMIAGGDIVGEARGVVGGRELVRALLLASMGQVI